MGISWWRLAFIFGPAIARGDISSFSLYTPFIFGHLLGRVVKNWKGKTKLRGWPYKIPPDDYRNWVLRVLREIFFVVAFLAICFFTKTETRSLFNFFLSSFVCPMLRFWFPQRNKGPIMNGQPLWDTTWGNSAVHVLMVSGLIISWLVQGIDHIFLGFLFLQAVPEIQRMFWMKPTQHLYLVSAILILCFPFYSIGIMAWYTPTYLEYLPKPYLQGLCWFANAKPSVPDYYSVLGVSPDADMKTIKKVFREQAIELHPDKVGDDEEKLARFHAIQQASDALTKGRAEYDKSIENQELNEMVPRCYAFLVMMGYWLLHSLIDWNDVESMRDSHKDSLRNHVMRDGPVDYRAIGLHDEEKGKELLKQYCEPEDIELPFLSGKNDDILEMRRLLETTGFKLEKLPQVTGKIEQVWQEIVLGAKDQTAVKDISTVAHAYVGYEITIEDEEQEQSATSFIVEYAGGDKRIASICPALDFQPNAGSTFTLNKPGAGHSITGVLQPHPLLGKINQVFILGAPEKNDEYDWTLHTDDGFYNGYKLELKNDKTLIGAMRIYEYWPSTRKIVLESKLVAQEGKQLGWGMLMGKFEDAEIKPEPLVTDYTITAEDLVPRQRPPLRTAGEKATGGPPGATRVAPQVMAAAKNVVGAPKGSVAAKRNLQSKMQRQKAYVKKVKGGSGCVVM